VVTGARAFRFAPMNSDPQPIGANYGQNTQQVVTS